MFGGKPPRISKSSRPLAKPRISAALTDNGCGLAEDPHRGSALPRIKDQPGGMC